MSSNCSGLSDSLVLSQVQLSAKRAEEAREQAPPLTHSILVALVDLLHRAAIQGHVGMSVYIGFILTLAFGCLRWSDLQRSCTVGLSKDSLYGESWRSKRENS